VVPVGGGALCVTEGAAALAFGRVGGALALALRASAPAASAVALAGLADQAGVRQVVLPAPAL
jgi:hypothetical protein